MNYQRLLYVTIFSIAVGYFEAAVVVYLRGLYYPAGFSFPLMAMPDRMYIVELFREFCTIIILISVAALAGRKRWERFGYFIILFGMWDIFYYIWLKAALDWPSSIFERDVLFLIPIPWIGPVIAPVAISVLMIIIGISLIRLIQSGYDFKPLLSTWLLAIAATAMLLYSFMHDLDATLRFQMPQPYDYWILISGLTLYIVAYLISSRKATKIVE